jgi:multidrug resistance efflux pump
MQVDANGVVRAGRRSWWIGLALVVIYVTWMLGPYLRSIVVRDAAVTMWINLATSPIYGNVDPVLPDLGSRVPAGGRIVGVRNEHADRTALDAAFAEVTRLEAVVAEHEAQVAGLERIAADWRARRDTYAATFRQQMQVEVDGARRELGYLTRRLGFVRALAERKEALARRGSTAQSESDEANAELAELELQRVQQEKVIALAELRLAAAMQGSYLLDDGADPDWAVRTSQELDLELVRITGELASARAELVEAKLVADAEAELFEILNEGKVAAPPGSVIWSMIVGAGAAVDIGSPVAQWLDCGELLVDVPLSDVEVALLEIGAEADVVLEGETESRRGKVFLTRGSAATLGSPDLAAIAKGRQPGVGQALLRLEVRPGDTETCPVGRAAFVDFPRLGLIDILRARLRL